VNSSREILMATSRLVATVVTLAIVVRVIGTVVDGPAAERIVCFPDFAHPAGSEAS